MTTVHSTPHVDKSIKSAPKKRPDQIYLILRVLLQHAQTAQETTRILAKGVESKLNAQQENVNRIEILKPNDYSDIEHTVKTKHHRTVIDPGTKDPIRITYYTYKQTLDNVKLMAAEYENKGVLAKRNVLNNKIAEQQRETNIMGISIDAHTKSVAMSLEQSNAFIGIWRSLGVKASLKKGG